MLSQMEIGENSKSPLKPLKTHENEDENGHQNNDSDTLDMRKLLERITSLEQELHQYKFNQKYLMMATNTIGIASAMRKHFGTLVWQIDEFKTKVQEMLITPNRMFFSPDFYTDPHGYRFCGRISISTKSKIKDSLSFHVHMMRSSNDFHLPWPFRGCIQIFLINNDYKLIKIDKIMSIETSTAFQRPNSDISSHSYGYLEYANINSIINDGFLSNDGTLTIKLHITIV